MGNEILHFAQDDTGWPIRLSSPDELMEQYVGINGHQGLLYGSSGLLPAFMALVDA